MSAIALIRCCRMRGAIVLAAVAIAGCASLPPGEPAPLPSPDSVKLEQNVAAAAAAPQFEKGDWPANEWWRMFGDPQLDTLIQQALADNPDVRIAEARVRVAQQVAAAVHGGNFPAVSVNGNVTREKYSENGLVPPPYGGQTFNTGQLSLDALWDLDLWGQNRDRYRARLNAAQAAAADRAETHLVISATLARAYFSLQGNLARLDVARAAVTERKEFADIVKARADSGLENEAAVRQANADVEREEATVFAFEHAVEANKREIAALLGKGPDDAGTLIAPASRFDKAFPLPAILPMDLLARRPDVLAGRWRVEAAAREIGAAKAGFYPNINIAGSIGYQSLDINTLLKPESVFGLIGPAIHLPIFAGGRLRANLQATVAEYDIAVEQYHRALVNAARDVADQLAAVRSLARQQERQAQALADSEEAYRIAKLRYESGITDYMTVLQVERDLLRQRDVTTQLAEGRLQAVLGLIKALGGGYHAAAVPMENS
jgi:NodT family efflux transporter outer membrane factor (OMF) lipoprotein